MTVRITVAILLVTWTILVIGDAAAFFAARETLLAMLDDSLLARATPLLDSALNPKLPVDSLVPPGDFYEIHNSSSGIAHSFHAGARQPYKPVVIRKRFETRPDGKIYRTITVRALRSDANGRRLSDVTISYSRPAEGFDRLVDYLIAVLTSVGTFCALASGWVALKVSRAALRPITRTADVIAAIDEQNLSRRIESSRLPTELVPMTHRLNELLERLERVFSQRKQFLADAAHELRTPTAALLTTLEVALRRPRDPQALQQTIQSALSEARMLRRLVDKLMEHARGEQMASAPVEEVDVKPLLQECVCTIQPIADQRQITIKTALDGNLQLRTQPDRLRSVMLNLLSNAVEYNRPGGSVNLRVRIIEGKLEISVQDTGPGIAPDHLPHVFEPFYRADRQTRGDTEHLGLGLFLVQSHLHALHGTCRVESTSESGTRVVIKLPALWPESASRSPAIVEMASA